MDHREYIERYLSADLDQELSVQERREVTAHLAGCAQCREQRAEEEALKALLREHLPIIPAPAALRQGIAAALDDLAAIPKKRPRRVRMRLLGVPLAAAAALAAVTLVFRGMGLHFPEIPPHGNRALVRNPAFDAAVASYLASEKRFTPNIASRTVDELANSLNEQIGFPFVWDFSSVGLKLAGARVDRQPDGKVVVSSLYKGTKDSILCINYLDLSPFPSGGQLIKGIHVYRYKNLHVCATRYNGVACLMVTLLPAQELARAFSQPPAS